MSISPQQLEERVLFSQEYSDKLVEPQPTVLAIGVFDGVHRGHQTLLAPLKELALSLEGKACVYTFRQHPSQVLSSRESSQWIQMPEQRYMSLLGYCDYVIADNFDLDMAKTSPEDFIVDILCQRLSVAHVIIGENFRFGYKAQGNWELLQEIGKAQGFQVTVCPRVHVDGAKVSSTTIRQAIREGQVDQAHRFMGHRFKVCGEVESGMKKARELNFPTANIRIPDVQVQPKFGVYRMNVQLQGRTYQGVGNYGVKPTFGSHQALLEVHLFDFMGNIYGENIEVEFCQFLRGELQFDSEEHLREQIKRDVALAQKEYSNDKP